MSGNPTGSNVVPMPHAQAPATNPQQVPMPFPMWGGGGSLPWGPGCCPPGGMDALLKCYCDVQAATAFICSVMVQCVQTNPAVTAAIIAAIEASGSSLPTLGVTNGSNAQPGQVGEWMQLEVPNIPVVADVSTVTQATAGVLTPGDWDCFCTLQDFAWSNGNLCGLNPTPAGFSTSMFGANIIGNVLSSPFGEANNLICLPARASITVPTLVNFQVTSNYLSGPIQAGQSATLVFQARRAR